MALIKCEECGKEFSKKAKTCPHCVAFLKCKECGMLISIKAKICRHCGEPLPPPLWTLDFLKKPEEYSELEKAENLIYDFAAVLKQRPAQLFVSEELLPAAKQKIENALIAVAKWIKGLDIPPEIWKKMSEARLTGREREKIVNKGKLDAYPLRFYNILLLYTMLFNFIPPEDAEILKKASVGGNLNLEKQVPEILERHDVEVKRLSKKWDDAVGLGSLQALHSFVKAKSENE